MRALATLPQCRGACGWPAAVVKVGSILAKPSILNTCKFVPTATTMRPTGPSATRNWRTGDFSSVSPFHARELSRRKGVSMCKLLVSTRLPALVCLAFAVMVISASGDDKPQPKTPRPSVSVGFAGSDQQILNELDEPTELEFVETPLIDVIAAISTRHKNIPIQLDAAKARPDTPITFKLQGFPLRYALRLLLKEHDLDFVLSHDVLLVTSIEKPTILRKFEVADLLSKGTSVEKLGEAVRFRCHESRQIILRPMAKWCLLNRYCWSVQTSAATRMLRRSWPNCGTTGASATLRLSHQQISESRPITIPPHGHRIDLRWPWRRVASVWRRGPQRGHPMAAAAVRAAAQSATLAIECPTSLIAMLCCGAAELCGWENRQRAASAGGRVGQRPREY